MYRLISFLAAFAIIFAAHPQDSEAIEALGSYCVISSLSPSALPSAKQLSVSVDFGSNVADPSLPHFDSMLDALNFLAADGWYLVKAYSVPAAVSTAHFWILKKAKKKEPKPKPVKKKEKYVPYERHGLNEPVAGIYERHHCDEPAP